MIRSEKSIQEPSVLYEDNHVIVVFKPHRLLVQPDSTGDFCLMDWTKDWLKTKYKKPGNVFLGLIHRIDRPVAGVVVFGKTSKGASRLSEQVRTRKVRKIYRALVENKVIKAGHLEGEIDGKKAELYYKVVRGDSQKTEIEVELVTGRKHQIRIQMASLGYPIVGDKKFGATTTFQKGAIALMAYSLTFTHPVEKDLQVKVEVPNELLSF